MTEILLQDSCGKFVKNRDYKKLQKITKNYKRLQKITKDYKKIQKITNDSRNIIKMRDSNGVKYQDHKEVQPMPMLR